MNPQRWNHRIDDLVALASGVRASQPARAMSSRTVAQCLSGVMSLIAQRYGVHGMQATCAELVRFERAWTTSLSKLPSADGSPTDAMVMVATVARGLLPLAGELAVKEALSYWATESNPAAWVGLSR